MQELKLIMLRHSLNAQNSSDNGSAIIGALQSLLKIAEMRYKCCIVEDCDHAAYSSSGRSAAFTSPYHPMNVAATTSTTSDGQCCASTTTTTTVIEIAANRLDDDDAFSSDIEQTEDDDETATVATSSDEFYFTADEGYDVSIRIYRVNKTHTTNCPSLNGS